MGDVLSTNLSNLNDIFTSPDWSPPSAIYSNFNFSTWTIPSFPAVPSGNQVRKKKMLIAYLLVLVKLKLNTYCHCNFSSGRFQGTQVHLLLWNTDCLFCDWFKPISSWTYPSTTIAGGRHGYQKTMNTHPASLSQSSFSDISESITSFIVNLLKFCIFIAVLYVLGNIIID